MEDMLEFEAVCPACGTKNHVTYDLGVAREKLNCSKCGQDLGRLAELREHARQGGALQEKS